MRTTKEEQELLKALLNLVIAHPEDWEERVERALDALLEIHDSVGDELQVTVLH